MKTFKLFGIIITAEIIDEPCNHPKTKYLNDGDGGAPMYQCKSCHLAGSYFNGKFTPVTIDNLGMFV